MKKLFKEFYFPDEKETRDIWENENTLFVLDTNILLNLYRYKKETTDDFFRLLKKVKNKVFLPHHVALEYQNNRISVIAEERKRLNYFINALKDKLSIEDYLFIGDGKNIYNQLAKKYPELKEGLNACQDKLQTKYEESLAELKKTVTKLLDEFPQVNSFDSIRDKLDELKLHVGTPYSKEDLDKIYNDGELRYNQKIPPGFEDKDKNEKFYFQGEEYYKKYGDYIIWTQIIKQVKKKPNIANVIFISDDLKKDWIQTFDSEGQKIIGAHTELRAEIYKECKNINCFEIYNSSRFLELGNEVYKLRVQPQSFDDINNNFKKYDDVNRILKGWLSDSINPIPSPIGEIRADRDSVDKIEKLKEDLSHYEEEINSCDKRLIMLRTELFSNPTSEKNSKFTEFLLRDIDKYLKIKNYFEHHRNKIKEKIQIINGLDDEFVKDINE